jgi:hypothetical protein
MCPNGQIGHPVLSRRNLERARPRLWMHLLPSVLRPFLFGGD